MYKFTSLFQQTTAKGRVAGWSETWYFDGSETAARAVADGYNKRRSGLISVAGGSVAFRLQQVGQRALVVENVYPGISPSAQDIPQMALQCSVLGQGVNNRKVFQLRGIPDSIVDRGDYVPTVAFQTNFDALAAFLPTNQVRFRAINQANPQVNIISISQAGVMVLAAPLTFAVGSYITLLRCKATNGESVSGTYFVQAKASNTECTLAQWNFQAVSFKGQARVLDYIYPIVGAATLLATKIGTRKVGRPFDLYRGRALRR